MESNEKLEKLAWAIFEKEKAKYSDVRYEQRLRDELKEISNQMESDYFWELIQSKTRFPKNDNNLFIAKLLRMVDDFDLEQSSAYVIGEFPDVDMDYLPMVQEYLKNEWAPKQFGKENVCNIGSYQTFGIKSGLLDMARLHGKDRDEILAMTTKIGLKDEDGKTYTWDKVLEEFPELKKYCDENPDVADGARRLLNRNRGNGKHAAGLIIANQPIDNLVPLIRTKDGQLTSAFVEGLHGTDLGPLGLIKFDCLVITNLMQLAKCCKLIKDRHGIDHLWAKPGKSNWTDISYLDDPKALALANEAKLKCIFQFDSDGIRQLVKRGGVTRFEDMVVYNALYRPGPLGMKMHDRYVERKQNREQYYLHPLLEPILGKSYGVMAFQESIMKILKNVGDIPDMHCEIIRKAISKKKAEIFGRYKEMFIRNGQKNLGYTLEQIQELWDGIEKFSEYGFNRSHSVAYAMLAMRLLCLKAHYPLEFFASTLFYEKDSAKIKEYKFEAETMGVKLNSVDINKSKVSFDICDGEVYMGFANIKGVGDIADRIVAGQPYASFEDFLTRFGTESKVLKPLISLRAFQDAEPEKLWHYYEYFKEEQKKVKDRNKRFDKNQLKLRSDVSYLLQDANIPQERADLFVESFMDEAVAKTKEEFVEYAQGLGNEELAKDLAKLAAKYKKSSEGNAKKNEDDGFISLKDFVPKGEMDVTTTALMCDLIQLAERTFYGFCWNHFLETSADYTGGRTYLDFDLDEQAYVRMCELHVVAPPQEIIAKTGTKYYIVNMEDSNSQLNKVQFWEDDYQRFKEELNFWEGDVRKGNFLRIRLKRFDPRFRRYTFDSPQKHLRWREVPKEKENDHRLQVMARPAPLVVSKPKPPVNTVLEL